MPNQKTAICVILYNPSSDFSENLKTYFALGDKVFIVDNSEVVNENVIRDITKAFVSTKIELIINRENKGLSIPFNDTFLKANAQGFNYLLTMDQDSYFQSRSLFEEAYEILESDQSVGLIGMSHYNTRLKRWFKKSSNFVSTTETISSGSLIRISALQKIGGFDKRLFIDGVDNDLCMNLKIAGFKILQSKKKILAHNLGQAQLRPHRISRKEKSVSLHSPLRSYYVTRNSLLFIKKFFFANPYYGFRAAKYYFQYLKNHYLYAPDYDKHKIYIKRGFEDFFKNKFGKYS